MLYLANFVEQEYYGIMEAQEYTDESLLPKISAVRKRYQTIIEEFENTIDINNKVLKLLTKEELVKLILHLRDQLFNNSLLMVKYGEEMSGNNNNQTMRDLFNESQNLNEIMAKITEILPKQTDIKMMTQLSMAYIFIWIVKTQFTPAYFSS